MVSVRNFTAPSATRTLAPPVCCELMPWLALHGPSPMLLGSDAVNVRLTGQRTEVMGPCAPPPVGLSCQYWYPCTSPSQYPQPRWDAYRYSLRLSPHFPAGQAAIREDSPIMSVLLSPSLTELNLVGFGPTPILVRGTMMPL